MSPVSQQHINQLSTNESLVIYERVNGKAGSQPTPRNLQQRKAKEASLTTSVKPPQAPRLGPNAHTVISKKGNRAHWSHRHPTLRERGMVATRVSGNPTARVRENQKGKARPGRRDRLRARAHGPVAKENRKDSIRKESASPKETHSTSFHRQPQHPRTQQRRRQHLCVVIFAIL